MRITRWMVGVSVGVALGWATGAATAPAVDAPSDAPSGGVCPPAPPEPRCDPTAMLACATAVAGTPEPASAMGALPFEPVAPSERRERWEPRLRAALARCDAAPTRIDCGAFPCVAARPGREVCDPEEVTDGTWIEVPVPVRCDPGVEWVTATFLIDEDSLASVVDPETPRDVSLVFGLLAERIEAVTREWRCGT